MARNWRKTDLSYLKRYARTRSVEELAERFRTDAAAVRAKLKELGLAPKDGGEAHAAERDPLVAFYEKGLKALHQGRWEQAADCFEKVARESDQAELVARARQYLDLCHRRSEDDVASRIKDPYLRAVVERNRGNLKEALRLATADGRHREDERFAYLAASVLSLLGDLDAAAQSLARSIELNPKNRIHAYHDSDFESLRRTRQHARLFARP